MHMYVQPAVPPPPVAQITPLSPSQRDGEADGRGVGDSASRSVGEEPGNARGSLVCLSHALAVNIILSLDFKVGNSGTLVWPHSLSFLLYCSTVWMISF